MWQPLLHRQRGAAQISKLCWHKNNEGRQLPGRREGARRWGAGERRGAPERWDRRETGNEFPETGNKALSQSVAQGGGGLERGSAAERGQLSDGAQESSALHAVSVSGKHFAFCREGVPGGAVGGEGGVA